MLETFQYIVCSRVRIYAATSIVGATLTISTPAVAGSCEDLGHLLLPKTVIVSSKPISSGNLAISGQTNVRLTDLPPFCLVRGVVTPVPNSRIEFEVWLPLQGWSERLYMVGNGGYSPDINYDGMAGILRAGGVAVATNTGHEAGDEPSFSIGRPESIVDWAYRAVHSSVVVAKEITKVYYSQQPRYSYFKGCSTGGYQALTSAQRYPEDFSGIIAGAPGNNRGPLMMSFLWMFQQNHPKGDNKHEIVSKEKLLMLTRSVVNACDARDGVVDGVINDPRACRFDIDTLQCKGVDRPDCLTTEEIHTVRGIYEGPRDSRTGKLIYPGYPVGSEGVTAYSAERPGWSEYWADEENPGQPRRADFFRYFVFNDQNWDWWKFDWGSDVDIVNNGIGQVVNATNPDLSKFRANGGKLIMYMGWSDPVGAATEAINYYNSVEANSTGSTTAAKRKYAQEAVRLYMVPGMAHCREGPGATHFNLPRSAILPVPDAKHDMLTALEHWVENGIAPDEIIAAKYVNDDTKKRQIQFERPLCVYPKVARYKGGDQNAAASFECKVPDAR